MKAPTPVARRRLPAVDDEFERKLLAAMAAAEQGGGLGALGGGVQNSPPGRRGRRCRTHRRQSRRSWSPRTGVRAEPEPEAADEDRAIEEVGEEDETVVVSCEDDTVVLEGEAAPEPEEEGHEPVSAMKGDVTMMDASIMDVDGGATPAPPPAKAPTPPPPRG